MPGPGVKLSVGRTQPSNELLSFKSHGSSFQASGARLALSSVVSRIDACVLLAETPDMLYDQPIDLLDAYTCIEIHVWYNAYYLVLHLHGNRWNKQIFTFVLHKKGEKQRCCFSSVQS